ncbi:restriction endonuclease [Gemmobacter caeruleus]|uniref:restriction endonuclease n=1 Tax=Gemmobacter caeruleus TaxID=2595004 RepID=UPI001EEFF600|nr:restriction endonuclease [Gemmobacter caeruleus]
MTTIPDYQSLMLPVLRSAQQGEVRIGEVVSKIADQLELDDEARTKLLPSGRQGVLSNRVHWAKTYLVKAGLLEISRRGYFRLTASGKSVLDQQLPRIDNAFLVQFEPFRDFVGREGTRGSLGDLSTSQLPAAVSPGQTPDEVMRDAHREIEEALAQELLERVRAAPPAFFEYLIVRLMLAMGYGGTAEDAGRALGRSGDDGVDGVVDQDPLGLDRVYIQAKRFGPGNTVGSAAIRDFFGSLDRHKANKGLFVTTSGFSAAAHETASFLSKRIVLVDGAQLARLMIRYDIGCRIAETLHLKKLDEDFFD